MVTRSRQSGAAVETLVFVLLILMIVWAAVDVTRLFKIQDRLHLAVTTVGALAADIPPENESNTRFEQLLCGTTKADLRFDACPQSSTSDFLMAVAEKTLGLDDANQFAMRFEFISDPGIPNSQEYAKSEVLGSGNCDLSPVVVPGGVRIASYLTNPLTTSEVTLKNRAHHQFVYVAMCVESSALAGSLSAWLMKDKLNKELFADSMNLRRYWYNGDYIED
ncbi:hypothetical protein AB2S62_19395 [Vibrio sp. NTOU-M3]|uniref:hypothetical protein n=1 Tax=Vibrio sp. NTOU-M3 TaxID=3234954 RepID=UPI00349F7C06